MLSWSINTVLVAFLCSAALWAQKPAQIGLISDNDLYTSTVNDQYYTNGLEVFYRYLGNSSRESVAKKITEFRIGQYIYNPQSVKAEDINVHDRPFAGYLFAEGGINTFYRNENVLKMNFQLGVLGPESGAEAVQEQLHKLFDYYEVKGWEYQIPTTLGLQANVVFSQKIFPEQYKEKVDLHLQGEANVGTIWNGASVGAMARISLKGVLLPMYDSSLHGAAVNSDKAAYKEQREFYLYINPMVNYQLYDATIEGSLFSETAPPVTFPLIPLRINAEAGVKYRRNKWDLSYSFNYRGKELSNNVVTAHFYGSVVVAYLLAP